MRKQSIFDVWLQHLHYLNIQCSTNFNCLINVFINLLKILFDKNLNEYQKIPVDHQNTTLFLIRVI